MTSKLNYFKTMKQISFFLFGCCLLAGSAFGQTKKDPSMQDIHQQMLEMHRQMMQQFQQMSPGTNGFAMPEFKWDTTFSFSFDTLIEGNGMRSRFFFSPFGSDTTFMRGFGDLDSFFDRGNPFGNGFQWTFPPGFESPENDENSAIEAPSDGMLPEERLRIQEKKEGDPAEKKAEPAPKNPKIKTIRI